MKIDIQKDYKVYLVNLLYSYLCKRAMQWFPLRTEMGPKRFMVAAKEGLFSFELRFEAESMVTPRMNYV